MTSTRTTGFVLAFIVLLPMLMLSVNTFNAELDVELIESLTEEENDEKDSEYSNYLFILSNNSDLPAEIEEDQKGKRKNNSSLKLHGDLAFKVPTPPPENTIC